MPEIPAGVSLCGVCGLPLASFFHEHCCMGVFVPDDWTIDRKLDRIDQSLDAIHRRLVLLEQKTDQVMIVLKMREQDTRVGDLVRTSIQASTK